MCAVSKPFTPKACADGPSDDDPHSPSLLPCQHTYFEILNHTTGTGQHAVSIYTHFHISKAANLSPVCYNTKLIKSVNCRYDRHCH